MPTEIRTLYICGSKRVPLLLYIITLRVFFSCAVHLDSKGMRNYLIYQYLPCVMNSFLKSTTVAWLISPFVWNNMEAYIPNNVIYIFVQLGLKRKNLFARIFSLTKNMWVKAKLCFHVLLFLSLEFCSSEGTRCFSNDDRYHLILIDWYGVPSFSTICILENKMLCCQAELKHNIFIYVPFYSNIPIDKNKCPHSNIKYSHSHP